MIISEYINRKRLLALVFKINDIIILNSRNIRITRLSKLLDYKNLKPFRIIRVINNIICELELPKGMNIYSIFHSWLLYINNSDLLSEQIQ